MLRSRGRQSGRRSEVAATPVAVWLVLYLLLAAAEGLVQYTPEQADWSTFQVKAIDESSSNTAHDPDGIGWIAADNWVAAQWDGTVYNPSRMTKAEFSAAICPSVDRIRGIREVFYQHNPFADNVNPTKAELDEWHRIALNHVRALIGCALHRRGSASGAGPLHVRTRPVGRRAQVHHYVGRRIPRHGRVGFGALPGVRELALRGEFHPGCRRPSGVPAGWARRLLRRRRVRGCLLWAKV